jgi:AraC family transcriptional regulator
LIDFTKLCVIAKNEEKMSLQQQPRIEILDPKKLVGKHLTMCFAENRTGELWRDFMTSKRLIKNAIEPNRFSLQQYPATHNFRQFDPNAKFEKWAAVEVTDFSEIPNGFAPLELKGGLYAIFNYRGPSSEGNKIFGYIFGTWLPVSGYEIDHREHFEVLGPKYKNDHPDSEEEIWIPIRK